MKKHLISISDFSREDVETVLDLAAKIKKDPESYTSALRGRIFGLIFEKPSTRTWVSFSAGIFSLGGGTIYLGPEDIKLGIREEVRDVARVLDRYLTGVILRTFAHKTIMQFGEYFKGPIINGLSDFEHPCQALGDFFTLREKFPAVSKPVLSFIGDGNNVLNSLILLTALMGGELCYATPKKHEPSKDILARAAQVSLKSGARITATHNPDEAIANADAVYTDVWVSMGEEKIRKKKLKAFKGFQVNEALIRKSKKNPYVMHCLPAHRGEEVTDNVLESQRSIVFDQAENRLHVQKAVLLHLCNHSKS